MEPLPHSAERLAKLVLASAVAQEFPRHVTDALHSVARSDSSIDPTEADRLVRAALQAAITAEIAAMRQASAPGA
jgi:hypothetical protein